MQLKELRDLLIYQSESQNIKIEVVFNNDSFWLTQRAIAELFNKDIKTINRHLINIYNEEELQMDATISFFEIVQNENGRNIKRKIKFYSLDAIIAVGYRVNSKEATKFRIWATNTLKEFITKGYVLNKEYLKNGPKFGIDYFDKLLEEIREIRASERRFYQKITDIYKICSYDYDKDSDITKEFYANVQNKLHFAISKETAAEIIYNRVSSKKEHMGLTTWKNSPDGKILKSDITIAKNYLSLKEITALDKLVSMYIDFAERQAEIGNLLSMKDWKEKLEIFLKVNEYGILKGNGKIKKEIAYELALKEYEKYRVIQDKLFLSDFDELLEKIEN